MFRRPAPPPTGWATSSRRAAVFAFEAVLICLVLLRFHLAPMSAAFAALVGSLLVALMALLFALVAFVLIWHKGERGFGRSLTGFVLALVLLAPAGFASWLALSVPAIVDVSTDTADPPLLSHAAKDRPADANPATYPAGSAEYQREALPQIQSLLIDIPPDDIRKLVLRLMQERRWRVVADLRLAETAARVRLPDIAPSDRIEAVATSTLFGTTDDIAVRIRVDGGKTRIDMRSAARYGSYDFGANAAHVQNFLADLRDRALLPDQASQ
ncbi:DUF1499 domain-containing protein [Labrys okinawensis]|uniref:DUF1499 domain-containing protein n=1 Tax=Labrys okinawensis TaxID=346911 RepID=UPI0039BD8777